MSFLMKARAARTAQPSAAVMEQPEQGARNQSLERIEHLEGVAIPAQLQRESEELGLVTAAESDLEKLDKEEAASDGSRAALDAIASQRREVEHRHRKAARAAKHHGDALKELRDELTGLKKEQQERRRRAEAEALVAEGRAAIEAAYDFAARGAEQLARSEKTFRRLFDDYKDVEGPRLAQCLLYGAPLTQDARRRALAGIASRQDLHRLVW